MFPTTYLEWFFDGEWCRIGWDAHSPASADALREHGDRLAAASPDEHYRLVQPSVFADCVAVVVHEWRAAA